MSNDISEGWRDYKEHLKKVRSQARHKESTSLKMAIEGTGISLIELTEYHFRLIKDGRRVDYFPTSGTYHDLDNNKRGWCSIEKLLSMFND